MNLSENVQEGIRSIRDNWLRTFLTATIIAIGIMSLVGILTAVDSIQGSVDDSFAQFGANAFDIEGTSDRGRRRRRGREEKVYPPVKYKEALAYEEKIPFSARVSIRTIVTGIAEVKYGTKKTNPNTTVIGANEHFLQVGNFDLELGRNFSQIELSRGEQVAIIGSEIKKTLYDKINPINKTINILGSQYVVIAVLEEKGSSMGNSDGDRSIIIPLAKAHQIATNTALTYDIRTALESGLDFNVAIGEATALMRQIRKDPLGLPNSFQITRSESLATRLESITNNLRIGGAVVGFITLIGAAIGLMNIMLVSVTERTREIGVRKAMGATPFRIQQQFLIEAIVICQFGGVAGIIFGILIGNLISFFLGVTSFTIPWFWIVVAVIVSALVGILSGYYPAYKASRLDPIASLRFE